MLMLHDPIFTCRDTNPSRRRMLTRQVITVIDYFYAQEDETEPGDATLLVNILKYARQKGLFYVI